MTRKALLIGAQTNGLIGVLNDVAAMQQALEPRGFQIETLTGANAGRGGILDAYHKMITDARSDDVFVVYYSGHGGLFPPPADEPTRPGAPTQPDLQFIVPNDYADSAAGDFRGITSIELSVLLAQLTAVAPNATVILDCCHSAHMSRGALRVRSLLRETTHPHINYYSVQQHIADLIGGNHLDLAARIKPESNPRAVRVVACAPAQSAWEGTNPDGVEMGLFTDALTRALRATEGVRVNWSTLLDMVRREVQVFAPTQRPEAEGPSERMPFAVETVEPLATLPVTVTDEDRITLLGAPLLDVQLNDQFAIMPSDAIAPDDGAMIATATVDRLGATTAMAAFQLTPGHPDVPADARAHRIRSAAPALPVRLPTGDPVEADLHQAMRLWPLIRRAVPDETTAVEVAVNGGLVVRDAIGPVHQPYPASPEGIRQVVSNLQRLAQAAAVQRIEADDSARLNHRVVVEWGRIGVTGEEEPLTHADALIYAGSAERVFFRLRNDGDNAVYASLIDIGVGSRISVLTSADPGGRRIPAQSTYTYGWDEYGKCLTGAVVTWPDGIDQTYARPETVLVVLSDEPLDVSVLQQDGMRGAGQLHDKLTTGSLLERLLIQVATGVTRDVGPPPPSLVRYDVRRIDFIVSPTAPPPAELASFLIDERPADPVRVLSPRGAEPGRIAVRIGELIVRRNHAIFGTAVRVDTAVLTAGPDGQPVHWTTTQRFPNVHDDERLSVENLLVYLGPVVDYLDLAIWVSRDEPGSPDLSELLQRELTDPQVLAVGTHLADLVFTAPHAAVAVAAVGAGAVLINAAHRLLKGVVDPSIGLYRTSWLAQEGFGIGQHERDVAGFSFTLSIDSVL